MREPSRRDSRYLEGVTHPQALRSALTRRFMGLAGIESVAHASAVLAVDRKTIWNWLSEKTSPTLRHLVQMNGILIWRSQTFNLTTWTTSGLWSDAAILKFSSAAGVEQARVLALMKGASLARDLHLQEWWRLFELVQIWRSGYAIDAIAFIDWDLRRTQWKEGRRPRIRRERAPVPEWLPYDPVDANMSLRFGAVDAPPDDKRERQRQRAAHLNPRRDRR